MRTLNYYWHSLTIPEIDAQRCVHSRIADASCQRCVDVCHAQAWQLDDEQLGIDPDRCDGCGICAGVCQEAAISHPHNPLSVLWRDERIALIACEKVSDSLSNHSDGAVSCVHALSFQDLLKLYIAGHRRVLVSTAACDACSRGRENRLAKHLNRLNSLLRERREPLLERVNISLQQWLNILRSVNPGDLGKGLNRRKFLRQAVHEAGDYGLRQFELNAPEHAATGPVIDEVTRQWLSDSDEKALPHVPVIDTARCTACDTCIKLCPHGALLLDQNKNGVAYLINAVNCTDCRICVDVCQHQAIKISLNTVALETRISLSRTLCTLCGVRFNSLEASHGSHCPTCKQKKHHAALFQVLD